MASEKFTVNGDQVVEKVKQLIQKAISGGYALSTKVKQ